MSAREEATVAVVRQGPSLVARFSIPMKLMKELGCPERVDVYGKPQEGFMIYPEKEKGLKINYEISPSYVYVHPGYKRLGFDRGPRLAVTLRTEMEKEFIKLGGPPEGWIRGESMWLPGKKGIVEVSPPPVETRLSRHPTAGMVAHHPVPVPAEVEAAAGESREVLKNRLLANAKAVHDLKVAIKTDQEKLEALTGLKFKVMSGHLVIE